MLAKLCLLSILAYCGFGQLSQDCGTALDALCPRFGTVPCPICVTQAWRTLRASSCVQSSLGQRLVDHCQPTQPETGTLLFKATWSTSDLEHTPLPGFLRYLPVVAEGDPCGGSGRVTLVGNTFGLHTMMGHSIEQYNVAFWAPEGTLDVYAGMLDDDGVKMLRLAWDCSGRICYTIIWHVPNSKVVVELISNQTIEPPEKWQYISKSRHVFSLGESAGSEYMTPLHDSRHVSNLSEVIRYYGAVLGVPPLHQATYPSGTKIARFALPTENAFGHNVTAQYVEKPSTQPWTNSPTSCWPIDRANGPAFLDA